MSKGGDNNLRWHFCYKAWFPETYNSIFVIFSSSGLWRSLIILRRLKLNWKLAGSCFFAKSIYQVTPPQLQPSGCYGSTNARGPSRQRKHEGLYHQSFECNRKFPGQKQGMNLEPKVDWEAIRCQCILADCIRYLVFNDCLWLKQLAWDSTFSDLLNPLSFFWRKTFCRCGSNRESTSLTRNLLQILMQQYLQPMS